MLNPVQGGFKASRSRLGSREVTYILFPACTPSAPLFRSASVYASATTSAKKRKISSAVPWVPARALRYRWRPLLFRRALIQHGVPPHETHPTLCFSLRAESPTFFSQHVYLEGGTAIYTCSMCRAHLATRDHVVSEVSPSLRSLRFVSAVIVPRGGSAVLGDEYLMGVCQDTFYARGPARLGKHTRNDRSTKTDHCAYFVGVVTTCWCCHDLVACKLA